MDKGIISQYKLLWLPNIMSNQPIWKNKQLNQIGIINSSLVLKLTALLHEASQYEVVHY